MEAVIYYMLVRHSVHGILLNPCYIVSMLQPFGRQLAWILDNNFEKNVHQQKETTNISHPSLHEYMLHSRYMNPCYIVLIL